jgi:hypothetical protein
MIDLLIFQIDLPLIHPSKNPDWVLNLEIIEAKDLPSTDVNGKL